MEKLIDTFKKLVKEKPLGTVGGIIILVLFFTGIFANLLAPYPMSELHLADKLHPPSEQYLLGADNLGRDLLSRIIFGARISMLVGLLASSLDALIATTMGLISGYFGGKSDLIIQRFVDAWMCFPPMFIILTMMALMGPGLLQVILVLGIAHGIRDSRVVRSAVIAIKKNVYVDAAVSIGCSSPRILTRHILPNVLAPIIVLFTISMGRMIISEATISFLGYGIPPPQPSWGGMLSTGARKYMYEAPWLAIWPGFALAIVVFGINMFGDAIRDILDPRLRGKLGRYRKAKVR